ncbi:unnamed protein product [Dracunculus medinensis]|uniref:EF-hand domain-containing protein n=1 Tax=Dracunculus medinensis TaxID=318479 RepID=A0A0N4UEM3_DRAME|nr:unnamed protein product [Dracunculus medinensis]
MSEMNSCLSTAKVKDTTTLTEDELSASEFLSGLSDFPQTIYDDEETVDSILENYEPNQNSIPIRDVQDAIRIMNSYAHNYSILNQADSNNDQFIDVNEAFVFINQYDKVTTNKKRGLRLNPADVPRFVGYQCYLTEQEMRVKRHSELLLNSER